MDLKVYQQSTNLMNNIETKFKPIIKINTYKKISMIGQETMNRFKDVVSIKKKRAIERERVMKVII